METFLGVSVGVIAMTVFYLFSMWVYFKLRQKYSVSKYGVEVGVLLVAILVSIGVKFAIFFEEENPSGDFWQSMSTAFNAVFSGIGGLTFEGLSDFSSETVTSFMKCLYTASSLYAALMILSVLTAKISYEIYSRIRMFFTFGKSAKKGHFDFYVFSAITEETLTLANSIEEHYKTKEKVRKGIIVFTGPTIETFDGKNELHRKIMAHGYYYWSYSLKEDNDGGFFEHLHLPSLIDFFVENPDAKDNEPRIHFFAMDMNEKLTGLESANSSTVFAEIERLANKMILTKKDGTYKINKNQVTDFYVLSDNDVNYEFYNRKLLTCIEKVLSAYDYKKLLTAVINSIPTVKDGNGNELKKEITEKTSKTDLIRYLACYFQLHIINEAQIVGRCLACQRKNILLKGNSVTKENCENLVADSIPDSDGNYRVMVMGFGANGQQAMKQLYHATAYANENLQSSRFVVDAYDPKMETVSGLFGFNHPMFVCVDKNKEVNFVEEKEWSKDNEVISSLLNKDTIENYKRNFVIQFNKEIIQKEKNNVDEKSQNNAKTVVCSKFSTKEWEQFENAGKVLLKEENINSRFAYETLKGQMKLPVIAFHKVTTFGHEFLNYLDGENQTEKSVKSLYKAFIIALGDDENNISMANALLSDFKNEINLNKKIEAPFKQTVYVNIRNKDNNERINWTKQMKEKLPNIEVVIYGSSEEIFSYESIIENNEAMQFNYNYGCVQSKVSTYLNKLLLNACDASFKNLAKEVPALFSAKERYGEMRKKWIKLNAFKKLSNDAVSVFAPYYYAKILNYENMGVELKHKELMELSAIEHERWNRFHIMNGWIFAEERKDENKEHSSLCSFNMIDIATLSYDLVNVALANCLLEMGE